MSLSQSSEEFIKNHFPYRWPQLCLDYDVWNIETINKKIRIHDWQEIKFEKSNISFMNSFNNKQGLYMFVVKPNVQNSAHHSYILYVGETKNLKQRFESYFNYRTSNEPSDQLKRRMVIVWENFLYFNFIETDYATKSERVSEEYDLIDTICPPINDQFRSELLNIRKKELKNI